MKAIKQLHQPGTRNKRKLANSLKKSVRSIAMTAVALGAFSSSMASAADAVRDIQHMWGRPYFDLVCETYMRYVGLGYETAIPVLSGRHLEFRHPDSKGSINGHGYTIQGEEIHAITSSITLLNFWPEWGYVQYRLCGAIDSFSDYWFSDPPITYFRGIVDIYLLD